MNARVVAKELLLMFLRIRASPETREKDLVSPSQFFHADFRRVIRAGNPALDVLKVATKADTVRFALRGPTLYRGGSESEDLVLLAYGEAFVRMGKALEGFRFKS